MTAAETSITFVLVRSARDANIGSAARAIKTMGYTRLVLVDPQTSVTSEAYALAHGSGDVLDGIRTYATLGEALAGHDVVVGTTTRRGHDRMTPVRLRRFVTEVLPQYPARQLAVVFGSETSGLSNDDLEHCQFAVEIPTGPLFHSLNLAQAVQVVAYELFEASSHPAAPRPAGQLTPGTGPDPMSEGGAPHDASPPHRGQARKAASGPSLEADAFVAHEAPADDGARAHRLEQLVRGTEQFLHDVGYPRQTSVTRAVSDLRRVLGGTYLTQRDVNTVLGCYRHIRYQLRMAGVSPAPGDASPPLEAELGPERTDTSPST